MHRDDAHVLGHPIHDAHAHGEHGAGARVAKLLGFLVGVSDVNGHGSIDPGRNLLDFLDLVAGGLVHLIAEVGERSPVFRWDLVLAADPAAHDARVLAKIVGGMAVLGDSTHPSGTSATIAARAPQLEHRKGQGS